MDCSRAFWESSFCLSSSDNKDWIAAASSAGFSGSTKIPFAPFVACTLVGVLPRIFILAVFGSAIAKYTKPVLLLVFFAAIVFLAFKFTRMLYSGRAKK